MKQLSADSTTTCPASYVFPSVFVIGGRTREAFILVPTHSDVIRRSAVAVSPHGCTFVLWISCNIELSNSMTIV